MSLETMIANLTRDEKLAAMELIWRDLTRDAGSFQSPNWHKTVVADRLGNREPGQALPLKEAKVEIMETIRVRRASATEPSR
ncbi:MAG: addiction module protein [Planctomycetaceae bacterium]|jgi:hypothetical protein|nr:addiction module protein [Planctomycetaceae bacterium]